MYVKGISTHNKRKARMRELVLRCYKLQPNTRTHTHKYIQRRPQPGGLVHTLKLVLALARVRARNRVLKSLSPVFTAA